MEAGLSHEEISYYIYKRRATVSDIENGKGEVDARTLASLAYILNKPLGYFYPSYLYQELEQEDFTPLEIELISRFRKIADNSLREVAIQQVKAIDEFDPKEMIFKLAPVIAKTLEWEDEIIKSLRSRAKM